MGCSTHPFRIQGDRFLGENVRRVREKLKADTQHNLRDTKVQASKGVVQLSGFVNSCEQKYRAGEFAKTGQSVKEVVNNITVKETAK